MLITIHGKSFDKKKHLLVVTQYFWPENFLINDLVNELSKRGYKITVLTGKPNYPVGEIFSEFKKEPKKYSKFGNVSVLRVPILPRGNNKITLFFNYISFLASCSCWGFVKLQKIKYDTIIVYQPSPILVALPAMLFSKIRKKPMILWVFDLWPETLRGVGVVKNPLILKFLDLLVGFIYSSCDLVLVQSQAFISSVSRYVDETQKIRYVPAWANTGVKELQNINKQVLEIKKLDNDKLHLFFGGNFGEAQALPSLLETMMLLKNHPEIKWHFVGDGRRRKWFEDKLEKHVPKQRYSFYGQVETDTYVELIRKSDACLLTLSDNQVFNCTIPARLQMFFSLGKPVIAMSSGESKRIIEVANAGLTASAHDCQNFAKNIKKFKNLNYTQKEIFGRNGSSFYKMNFAKEKILNDFEHYIETLSKVKK